MVWLGFACKSEQKSVNQVSFEVLDIHTNQPISNVEIQVLDNGKRIYTNDEGKVEINESELVGFEIITTIEGELFAFELNHSLYQSKEINAKFGINAVFLESDTSKSYVYSKPVQFGDGITTGSLNDAEVDSAIVHALLGRLKKGEFKDMHGLLVFKDNLLVLEEYFRSTNDSIQFENNVIRDRTPDSISWNRKEKHYVASVNKPLTAIVAAIALDKFNVSVDSTIKHFLPNHQSYFEADVNKSTVAFYHTLNMTAGFRWNEWSSNDLQLLWKQTDFVSYVLERQNFGQRSGFVYNSGLSNMTLTALNTLVGGDIRTWAHENFYSELEIVDYTWQSQPNGLPEGAARMYLRPRDMLKIGITLLNDGVWNNKQVIPEAWVTQFFTKQVEITAGKYSYGFWLRSLNGVPSLQAEGDGGNVIAIYPTLNMVVVITQGNYLQFNQYTNVNNVILGQYVVPAVLN